MARILDFVVSLGELNYWHLEASHDVYRMCNLLLTTVPIMYRYTVLVVNREPVDYPAFWCNGLEGNSQAYLQNVLQFNLVKLRSMNSGLKSKQRWTRTRDKGLRTFVLVN